MMSAAPIFDSYAPIYESAGEEWVSLRLLQVLRRWLAANELHPRRGADLACGTGAAAVASSAPAQRT
jgi:ubiquinone/menaquinone biosynthesis C-methylase UbiE